jgi:hypothetical protein
MQLSVAQNRAYRHRVLVDLKENYSFRLDTDPFRPSDQHYFIIVITW